ncbi:hypothetical protein [Bacillus pumilus]|uniref:hypothetical protein n=1 Tax=Bacillus pumilus TaxID=1408 RepID=UPI0011A794CA|nr:hypothetical protein [Bacillus pumilus]
MANTELRKALNKVVVVGTLAEIKHKEWGNKKGINIELIIETDEFSSHSLKGVASYKTKNGEINKKAESFKTMINEYKSIANSSREEADKVKATGILGLNEYYTNGELKSYPELILDFASRQPEDDTHRAEFDVELFVKNVVPEKRHGEETGRSILNGYIPLYGGIVIPFSFIVIEEGSEFVSNNYEKNSTVKIYGDIINRKEKIEKEKESAFGKPRVEIKVETKREILMMGGKDPYDEDSKYSYNKDVINKALTERETYLEEKKKQADGNGNKNSDRKGGFGGGKSTSTNNRPNISDDDLPF